MSDTSRRLLASPDGEIRLEGLRLTCVCEGGTFERALRHLAALGGAIAIIVSGLSLTGAVPKPLLAVFVVWLVGGFCALLFVERRRPQHGTFEIDFDERVVRHSREQREVASYDLAGEAGLEPPLEDTDDEALDRWLVLRLDGSTGTRASRPRLLRLARAPLASLYPVLYHFRRHGLASAFPARAR